MLKKDQQSYEKEHESNLIDQSRSDFVFQSDQRMNSINAISSKDNNHANIDSSLNMLKQQNNAYESNKQSLKQQDSPNNPLENFRIGRINAESGKIFQKDGEGDVQRSPYDGEDQEKHIRKNKMKSLSILLNKKFGCQSMEDINSKWVGKEGIRQPKKNFSRVNASRQGSNTFINASNKNIQASLTSSNIQQQNGEDKQSQQYLKTFNQNISIELDARQSELHEPQIHQKKIPLQEGIDVNIPQNNEVEMNQSFELCDIQLQNIFNMSSRQIKDENQEASNLHKFSYQTNGIQNINNSNNSNTIGSNTFISIKKNSNALASQAGDKFSLVEIKKFPSSQNVSQHNFEFKNSIYSNHLMFQNEQILSPSKYNDQGSNIGFVSEIYSPSIQKKARDSSLNPTQNISNNINNSNNNSNKGDQSNLERSFGDISQAPKKIGFQGVWAQNAFLILTLTKKFITNLKELSMKYKFGQMKRRYFDLIDDKSQDYKYFQLEGYLKKDQPTSLNKYINQYKNLFNKHFIYIDKSVNTNKLSLFISFIFRQEVSVILPDEFFKIFWDTIILFLLIINVFYIPLKITFDELSNLDTYLLVFFEDIPSWSFVIDIIFNFNTAYYSKGLIMKSRLKIAKHYIRTALAWDLIIVVPFLFSSLFTVRYLNIILLLRSSKILKIANSIEELINLRQSQATVMQLLKLVAVILYIAHICGCFFYYMHVLQTQSNSSTQTWVVKFNIDQNSWISSYIASLYWSVITMVTIGYGDIYPITTIEKIYVIVITLLSCGVFAYAVNSIGQIIQDITRRNYIYQLNMSSLTNHMRSRSISNITQMKVRKYFQYLHQEQQQDNEDGQKMLGQCTSTLKNEVLTEMYSKVLLSKKEFRLNFSQEFLIRLAPKLRERRLGPEEILFNEKDYSRKVYFLMRGSIALQRRRDIGDGNQKDINIKILKKGDLVGLESFLSGSQNNVSAKTLNVVQLLYLRDEDFQSVMHDYSEDKEKYAMIKDKLNLQKSQRGLGLNCYLCNSFMHQFLNCPYMSYQPNEKKVITTSLKNTIQNRSPITRTSAHNTAAMHNVYFIQEQAIKYLLQFNPYSTLSELIDKIYYLQVEGALNIDIPDVLARYIQNPQQLQELAEFNEEENEQSQNNNHSPLDINVMEDSIRKNVANIGSNRLIQDISNNLGSSGLIQFGTWGKKSNTQEKSIQQYLQSPDNKNNLLDAPKNDRNNERKRSFRIQQLFADKDQVKISSKKLIKISSIDSQKQSENVNNLTPLLSHHLPNTPQVQKMRDNGVSKENNRNQHQHFKSIKEDEDSQEKATPGIYAQNSVVSNYYLDRERSVSIASHFNNNNNNAKMLESNKVVESKHEIDQGILHSHNNNQASYIQQIRDFMILPQFDKQKAWSIYFPQNNLSIVMAHYSKILDKRFKTQKKKKKKMPTHSHKNKQMQQFLSSIQARNLKKSGSLLKIPRNSSQKQSSIFNPSGGQTQNIIDKDVLISRDPSRSNLSGAESESIQRSFFNQ